MASAPATLFAVAFGLPLNAESRLLSPNFNSFPVEHPLQNLSNFLHDRADDTDETPFVRRWASPWIRCKRFLTRIGTRRSSRPRLPTLRKSWRRGALLYLPQLTFELDGGERRFLSPNWLEAGSKSVYLKGQERNLRGARGRKTQPRQHSKHDCPFWAAGDATRPGSVSDVQRSFASRQHQLSSQ